MTGDRRARGRFRRAARASVACSRVATGSRASSARAAWRSSTRASTSPLGKRVAIKLVQSLFANDDEIVHRFEREARSASAVESEHIVHVFDVGADPELGLFLVMELLKGEDLARVLARRDAARPGRSRAAS